MCAWHRNLLTVFIGLFFVVNGSAAVGVQPFAIPVPPAINAKAYILIDVNSGKILAEKNSEMRLPPASLTKMMTLYVASASLKNGQIAANDMVRVSTNAWKTGGSRMFVKEGQQVSVEDLLKGIIVDSGNDACVAVAEYLGSNEESFAKIMNDEAARLGLVNTHFTDSTGLPDKDHYTTAYDLSVLGRALIRDFPEYYHWYKQKWFTFNGIRQPNRNRLLWRNEAVDGLKTGFTEEAGYCLVSSAAQNNMRLLAVILGAPTEALRADDSERLLKYGFRFFETRGLFKAGKTVTELPVYKGSNDSVALGLADDQFVTIPSGQSKRLTISTKIPKYLQAPIKAGAEAGELVVKFDDDIIMTAPLYVLQDVAAGNLLKRTKDGVKLALSGWIGS